MRGRPLMDGGVGRAEGRGDHPPPWPLADAKEASLPSAMDGGAGRRVRAPLARGGEAAGALLSRLFPASASAPCSSGWAGTYGRIPVGGALTSRRATVLVIPSAPVVLAGRLPSPGQSLLTRCL